MATRIAVILLALSLGVVAAGCGDDSRDGSEGAPEETTLTDTTDEESFAAGRAIFLDDCGSCHTLSEAGTSGTVGPNLDEASPSVDTVRTQVREGGGAMPAFEGELSDDQIEDVAGYVAQAAGG